MLEQKWREQPTGMADDPALVASIATTALQRVPQVGRDGIIAHAQT